MAKAQALESSSAIPGVLAENWVRRGAAGTQTGVHMGCQRCRQWFNPRHQSTAPATAFVCTSAVSGVRASPQAGSHPALLTQLRAVPVSSFRAAVTAVKHGSTVTAALSGLISPDFKASVFAGF